VYCFFPHNKQLVIRDISVSGHNTSRVSHHGGTRSYIAPELQAKRNSLVQDQQKFSALTEKVKFTRKADVFAAGIVFLELVTLKSPKRLYTDTWPLIEASTECPDSLRLFLSSTLSADPAQRAQFTDLVCILKKGKDEITAISGSFFFSSKRISRVSISQNRRDIRRRTLDDEEAQRIKLAMEVKLSELELAESGHDEKAAVKVQRRMTLDGADLQKMARHQRTSSTPKDEIVKELGEEEKEEIIKMLRQRSVSRREEKETQKQVIRLADHREESSRISSDGAETSKSKEPKVIQADVQKAMENIELFKFVESFTDIDKREVDVVDEQELK
jgi:serine/threonine protein kinase